MKYELAKELKDAGFPQKATGNVQGDAQGAARFDDDNWAYAPTLEELIEACGDGRMYALSFIDDERGRWVAHDDHIILEGWGASPTEAVARLWLALNKK